VGIEPGTDPHVGNGIDVRRAEGGVFDALKPNTLEDSKYDILEAVIHFSNPHPLPPLQYLERG
jgi:hypothetical protein